jgi:hypothetical protein
MYLIKRKEKKGKNNSVLPYLLFLMSAVLFTGTACAQGNNLIYISGKVSDKETGKSLSGVSVSVKAPLRNNHQ